MHPNTIIFTMFLIFAGAALLSTAALYTRQSMLVAYILLGVLLGPWGLAWVSDSVLVEKTGDIGIIFLLFLLGLNLHPQNLLHAFRKTVLVALFSSLIFAVIGYGVGRLFDLTTVESLILGAAMMFSSTIIGLKLLPTTILHHQHTGSVMISILLMQDLIAIIVLLMIRGVSFGGIHLAELFKIVIALPTLLVFGYFATKYVLLKLFARFDRIHEYMFLLAIAWCLGMSELASLVGLSFEIGAFIAGVTIAANPISRYIAESLKPVRDFFLVLFFFSIGAGFNLNFLGAVMMPAMLLALASLLIKPAVFRVLLAQVGESKRVSWEVGVRLGQVSEFSLLVAYLAASSNLINAMTSNLIQATTIISFMVSSYFVVMRYPTPMAFSERLQRD